MNLKVCVYIYIYTHYHIYRFNYLIEAIYFIMDLCKYMLQHLQVYKLKKKKKKLSKGFVTFIKKFNKTTKYQLKSVNEIVSKDMGICLG